MSVFLQVENATKNYGDIVLFHHINFTINQGDKVALVARNGTGKTTLLNVLAGRDTFDSGNYYLNKDIKIGYLEQDPHFDPELTVFQNIYGAPGELMRTVYNYEAALHENNQKKLEEASAKMDFHHAWDLDARIRQMLDIFKLHNDDQKAGTLSGGQIKRLALVIALINEPQFLILDEPTNHLDLDMIEWLEEYLIKMRVTLLMVTHDRYFLDRICNDIIEIDEGEAFNYVGNYSTFLQKREQRIMNKTLSVEKAQNLLRTELDWMRRMPKARTTKAKYRIDAFYDLKKQSEYRRNEKNAVISTASSRLGKKILVLKQISKRFENQVILDQFSYTFTRGEKIGIIGPNGAGKTTFLNIIMGILAPDSGSIEHGETVVYSYYKQQGLEYNEGKRVIDIIQDIAEVVTTQDGKQLQITPLLNRFLFTPEMHNVLVDKLSGGEKRRLYLLTVLMRNPNFLILDEPTNDFDIITLNILEDFISEFPGCIIIVSHDRFFMDKLVDHLFVFEGNGQIFDFPGNYSEYRDSQKQQMSRQRLHESTPNTKTKSEERKPVSSVRKRSFKEKQELEQLTTLIESLEKEKNKLEQDLGGGLLTVDELVKGSQRIAEIISLLDQKTDRWLELSE